jgi:hypothetical protein
MSEISLWGPGKWQVLFQIPAAVLLFLFQLTWINQVDWRRPVGYLGVDFCGRTRWLSPWQNYGVNFE